MNKDESLGCNKGKDFCLFMVCSSGGDKIRSGLDTFRGRVGIRHDSPDLSKKRRQLYFWQLAVRLTFRRFTSTWERVKRDELVCTQASGALIPDRVSAQEHGIWAYRSAKSIHQGMFSSRQFACTGPPSSRSTHRTFWRRGQHHSDTSLVGSVFYPIIGGSA